MLLAIIGVLCLIGLLAWAFGIGVGATAARERLRIEEMQRRGEVSEEEADQLLAALGPTASPKPPDLHLRAAAIILMVIGILAIFGGLANWHFSSRKAVEMLEEFRPPQATQTVDGEVDPAVRMVQQFQQVALAFAVLGVTFGMTALACGAILVLVTDPIMRSRARAIGVALSVVLLLAIPLGTLLGIYVLYVLAWRKNAGDFI